MDRRARQLKTVAPFLRAAAFALAVALVACAPGGGRGGAAEPPTSLAISRTLVAMTQIEPLLAPSPLATGTSSGRGSLAGVLFSAALSRTDQERDNTAMTVWPELAEQLPRIDTDSWRVFADGRMETTWALRPGLTWHDGAPFTSDDVLFGWEVRSRPEYASATDLHLIEGLEARDPRTIVVRWSAPFVSADDSTNMGAAIYPLPRHLLGDAFAQQSAEQFASHAYFGAPDSYVGTGPYRLERWESGAFLEGSAFENYALGAPKIPRVKVAIVADKNSALASMLSGDVHMSFDAALFVEQGTVLKQEWTKADGGAVSLEPDQIRFAAFQLKRDFVSPPELLDVRVRQALAFAIERQQLVDGILGGDGYAVDLLVAPYAPFYGEAERQAQKYPYDAARAGQLLSEAGLVRGSDGAFRRAGEPFGFVLMASSGYDRERSILADMWRKVGVDVKEQAVSVTQDQDRQFRAAFTGVYNTSQNLGLPGALGRLNGRTVATPENRFSGNNYFGYANPEFDGLLDVITTSLRPDERVAASIQALRIASTDLPFIPMYLNPRSASAFSALLQPPAATTPRSKIGWWNVEQWQWKA
jgi:peptide/nickel transport system substrate-binding protein